MFFSEEKNQKTFMTAQAHTYGTWPDGWEAAEKQKFFASFFQKGSPFLSPPAAERQAAWVVSHGYVLRRGGT
jgi:hypothetical protein